MMVLINGRISQSGDYEPSPDDLTVHVGAFPSIDSTIGTGTVNSLHGQRLNPSDSGGTSNGKEQA